MKKMLKRLFIILSMWGIARLIPAILMAVLPQNAFLSTLLVCLFLPIAWKSSVKISDKNHATCIRVNLGIFIYLEISGVCSTLVSIIDDSRRSNVSLEAYAIFILMMIICSAIYIGLCVYFWRKTPKNVCDTE